MVLYGARKFLWMKFNFMHKKLPVFLLFNFPFLCRADVNAVESTYFSVDYVKSDIELAGKNAQPSMINFRLGTGIYDQISLEAQYSVGNSSNNISTLTFDLEQSKALYLLFRSYTINGFGIDVSLGYASTELTVKGPANSYSGVDDYNGFSWGASLYQEIPMLDNVRVRLGYQSLYHDGDMDITGFSLGLSYHF